jgi:hypothetical protein
MTDPSTNFKTGNAVKLSPYLLDSSSDKMINGKVCYFCDWNENKN